jgi:retron-type reverse transcriptase
VRRVEIEKPDGGTRALGLPIVQDRLIQQAISQVLSAQWEPLFSEHSYGFRPGRSAHQAVKALKQASEEGYSYAVDLDLAKFFDTVDHGVLLNLVRRQIKDRLVICPISS